MVICVLFSLRQANYGPTEATFTLTNNHYCLDDYLCPFIDQRASSTNDSTAKN